MNEYSRRHVMLALPSLGLASLGAAAVVSRRVYAQPTGLGNELEPYPSAWLPDGVRSRFVNNINGLRVHVYEIVLRHCADTNVRRRDLLDGDEQLTKGESQVHPVSRPIALEILERELRQESEALSYRIHTGRKCTVPSIHASTGG